MALEYKIETNLRTPRPRSKRLRQLGYVSGGSSSSSSSSSMTSSSGSSETVVVEGHTHDNKAVLDQIGSDDAGYGYLTRTVETDNEETGLPEREYITEKVKAGFADEAAHADKATHADMAHDLDEDSPVMKKFLSRLNDDVAEGRISFREAAIILDSLRFGKTFVSGIVGGVGGRIDSNGDAELNSLTLRRFLEVPELRYNRTTVINGVQWNAPGCGIIDSVPYCGTRTSINRNLLNASNVRLSGSSYKMGEYLFSERPAAGTKVTLTFCYKCGERDNFISVHFDDGFTGIAELQNDNFNSKTETVVSVTLEVCEPPDNEAVNKLALSFYHQPNDKDFDPGTYVKWAVMTLGDDPVDEWIPSANDFASGEGIVALKLEEGEIPTVQEGDLCMGIHHLQSGNHSGAEDTSQPGQFQFAGFTTIYFRVESVDTSAGTFRYKLRDGYSVHPQEAMTFVAYGNNATVPTNKAGAKPEYMYPERQTSAYQTRSYLRFLGNVTDWDILSANIMMQFGDLSGLVVDGHDMSGYSAYLNNVYFTGTIQQLKNFATYEWVIDPAVIQCDADGIVLDQTVKWRVFRVTPDGNREELDPGDGNTQVYGYPMYETGHPNIDELDTQINLYHDPQDGAFKGLYLELWDEAGHRLLSETTVSAVRNGADGEKGDKGDPGESIAGPTGPSGAVLRNCGLWDSSRTYLYNQTDPTSSDTTTAWIDYVYTTNSDGSLSWWKNRRASNKNSKPNPGNSNWTQFSNMGDILVDALIASNVAADYISSREVVFKREDSEDIYGRIGFPKDGYTLWFGAQTAQKATTVFTDRGKATFGVCDGNNVTIDPDERAITIADASGEVVSRFSGDKYSLEDAYGVITDSVVASNGNGAYSDEMEITLGSIVIPEGAEAQFRIEFDALLYADSYFKNIGKTGEVSYRSSVSAQIDVFASGDDHFYGNILSLESPTSVQTGLITGGSSAETTDTQGFTHKEARLTGTLSVEAVLDNSRGRGDRTYWVTLHIFVNQQSGGTGLENRSTGAWIRTSGGDSVLSCGSKPMVISSANGLTVANSTAEWLRIYPTAGNGKFCMEFESFGFRKMLNASGEWIWYKGEWRRVNYDMLESLGILE